MVRKVRVGREARYQPAFQGANGSGERIPWLDFAKAFAIIAVVVTHVTTKFAMPLGLMSSDLLVAFVVAFQPLRMPIFFLVSGLLARSALSRSWGNLLRRKTASYYYIYVVWLVLQTAFFLALPADVEVPTDVATSFSVFMGQLTYNPGNLWYLWALALFFPLAKIGRIAPGVAVGSSIVLALPAAMGFFPELGLASTALLNLPWFLAGAYFSTSIKRLAQLSGKRILFLGCMSFILLLVAYLGIRFLGLREVSGVVYVPLCAAGLFMIVVALPRVYDFVSKHKWATGSINYIGANTVRIYVLHVPCIALISHWFPSGHVGIGFTVSAIVLVSLIVIGICLALAYILDLFIPALFAPAKWVIGKANLKAA